MRIIKCDRCPKEIENLSDVSEIFVMDNGEQKRLDLCPTCKIDFDRFMKNGSTTSTAKKIQKTNKVTSVEKKKQPGVLKKNIIKLINEGKETSEIAKILNCKSTYVSSVRWEYNKSLNEKEEQKKDETIKEEKKSEVSTVLEEEPVEDINKRPIKITLSEKPKKKIDTNKVRALLRAGWSFYKISAEVHASIDEIKDALENEK